MVSRLAPVWRAVVGCRAVAIGLYFIGLLALFGLAAQAAGHLAVLAVRAIPVQGAVKAAKKHPAQPVERVAMTVPKVQSEGSATLTQGWFDWGRGPRDRSNWRDRDRGRDRHRDRDRDSWGDDEDDGGDRERRPWGGDGNAYRTVCVRLCDGYYWPMSFATTPENFERDRQKCESSCGSPTRLYRYKNPGGDIESMEDINGRPYRGLRTAFLYRTQYNAACKCKADPWEREAMDRHRMYALEASKRKGDQVATRELEKLKAEQAEASKALARSQAQVVQAAEKAAQPAPANVSSVAATSNEARPRSKLADENERMSLGARSEPAPSRSSGRPMRSWNDRSDYSP